MKGIRNQVGIITGGTRGIGAAVAQKLFLDGAKLVLVARTQTDLEATADKLGSKSRILTISADITMQDHIKMVVERTLERFGRIDFIVNNAGLYISKPFIDFTPQEIDDMIDVDLRGLFLLTKSVLPFMKSQGYGHIINIASETSPTGIVGVENQALHCACKFAIIGFSQSLFHELRKYNIKVSYVCPNSTNTWGDPDPTVYLRPEDVADVVEFVLSTHRNNAIVEVAFRALRPSA